MKMIILNTHKSEIYCKIIHNYLEVELFGDSEIDIGDTIESYMPKYLFREQYKKCIEVFKDLYKWTNDYFWHELTAFHEVTLYYFLMKMSNIKEDMQKNFEKIYYDKKLREEIEDSARKDKKDLKEFTIQELKKDYYNPDCP